MYHYVYLSNEGGGGVTKEEKDRLISEMPENIGVEIIHQLEIQ